MRNLFLLLALTPLPAFSEGAVQTFDCMTTSLCDETGRCAPPGDGLDGRVTFRVEPIDAGPDGEGDYRISYGDVSSPMTNVTGVGPLLWSEGDGDSQVVLFTGEANLLWQRFDATAARSSISFLSCEVTR